MWVVNIFEYFRLFLKYLLNGLPFENEWFLYLRITSLKGRDQEIWPQALTSSFWTSLPHLEKEGFELVYLPSLLQFGKSFQKLASVLWDAWTVSRKPQVVMKEVAIVSIWKYRTKLANSCCSLQLICYKWLLTLRPDVVENPASLGSNGVGKEPVCENVSRIYLKTDLNSDAL